jgi:6,7-dimethyl-8-ribityllumazine synthase
MPSSHTSPHILIVEARYYEAIGETLFQGAVAALEAAGASWERLEVPGAFEIPTAIEMTLRAMSAGKLPRPYDGFVTLGCVIRGETSHYDHVCEETARGVQDVALRHAAAIGFGVLTVENGAQAWARARHDRKNKGGEAVAACLAMVALRHRLGIR